jgi:hypothetical protein
MDVNILVYAHREDTADHPAYRDWLEEAINSAGSPTLGYFREAGALKRSQRQPRSGCLPRGVGEGIIVESAVYLSSYAANVLGEDNLN